jgi:TfoX/Sxy family transcriptional regulator of competence genes
MPATKSAKKTAKKTAKKGAKKSAKRKMPAFTEPTEKTVRAFMTATDSLSGVERRTMFGYPSVFLNGNMLSCIFQDRIMVRLSPSDRELAAKSGARPFEPSPGRAMREYVELPAKVIGNASDLGSWLERGRQFVATMPVKKRKA